MYAIAMTLLSKTHRTQQTDMMAETKVQHIW